ncbi:prolyl oligopeptidase family serine peptidase [Sphingobacterium oryzagri]|uniref:Prolyl oligopeptidase family serine peptidase n=1 Tax=Sphingobacterium oryzagri TaxID=3025669 RepID=A0ABY7WL50_9SPHI|nr:prolyl oligopeptidase family serine peptidase [Sphingobacterium sp. KACC 22765]WDF69040.1 prolyl oligopeptidase family serine peptidase [Sphingobacterium sp. KACC 22765]
MKSLFFCFFISFCACVYAQENITFQKPSAEILALADYQRPPTVAISPDESWILLSYRPTYKSLADLNEPEVRLAGLRINPQTSIASATNYMENIKLKKFGGAEEIQIKNLPENARLANISFSPDSKTLAFTHTTTKGVSLWIVDLASATAKSLTEDDLNAAMGSPYQWYKDGQRLLISRLPESRAALIDTNRELPSGPTVSTSTGKVSQLRTYQDLLKTPQDETNFETLAQASLYAVDLQGKQSKILDKAIYSQRSLSPDGRYLLVTQVKRPFSYVVPYANFPQETAVFDAATGKQVKVVNETPLMEIMPKGFSSTRPGKRSVNWRADKAATLVYVEALDGGDASKKVEWRDEVFSWDAPFSTAATSLVKVADRYAGIIWGDKNNALVYTQWYDTRSEKIFLLDPETKATKLVSERNTQDVYNDPGNVHTTKNEFGAYVMLIQGNKCYWVGDGFTKEGQFPFVTELDLRTLAKKRLYTSDVKGKMERITRIMDIKKGEILVSIQSPTDYPNYYVRNIKSGKTTALTALENPFQALAGVHKEVIQYQRKDGVNLSGTLYLPAGYDKTKKEKLPLLIWAYPTEYKDKNTAGQTTANPYEFTYPSYGSFVYWVNKGYAVLDDAAFPIIGEGDTEPNDTFIEQLVANGEAAIDAVDKLGYIDRTKVGVGGHSYGAFMTANLLTHSKLFAVGIARSGAYNRTLTPFGFQREQRNYWDVPSVYNTMSPFMHADKMKTPMLLIHGAADNNPGTFTLQTERYFQALKNLGAPVRMVLLPFEAHGYVSKENILHTLWEQDQFLEKYLKNK